MKYLYFIIICTPIIYLILKNRRKKHKFWDKQPVPRNNLEKKGKIKDKNPIFNLNLSDSLKIVNLNINSKSNKIFNFINNNFSDNYNYSDKLLLSSLNHLKNSKVNNIGLYKNDEIIGFIHAKSINLFLNKSIKEVMYVDYLCVGKKYRNKNFASFLISSLINSNNNQIFIFKKEGKSLPFNYINNTNYYYKDISLINNVKVKNNNFLDMTSDNVHSVYKFIEMAQKKKKIYHYLTIDEFKELYFNTSKNIIIEYGNDKNIKAVIIYKIILFSDEDLEMKTVDIEYIYTNGLGEYSIMDYLIKKCKNNNIKIISLVDQSNNRYFINRYNFTKSMNLYFHMYNYNLGKKISSYDMCFNIL